MALTDFSFPVSATLTDKARNYMALAHIKELGIKVIGFSVGTNGFNPSMPNETTAIDPTLLTLENQCYPVGTECVPFQDVEEANFSTRVYNCRLPAQLTNSPYDKALGEIGIWAEVISSQHAGISVGDKFLYAVAHMPCRCKTYKDVFLFRVVVNY